MFLLEAEPGLPTLIQQHLELWLLSCRPRGEPLQEMEEGLWKGTGGGEKKKMLAWGSRWRGIGDRSG